MILYLDMSIPFLTSSFVGNLECIMYCLTGLLVRFKDFQVVLCPFIFNNYTWNSSVFQTWIIFAFLLSSWRLFFKTILYVSKLILVVLQEFYLRSVE